jgi:hypothetical protein
MEFNLLQHLNKILNGARNNPAFQKDKPFIIIVMLEQEAGPIRVKVKYWGDITSGKSYSPFGPLDNAWI